MVGSAWAAPCTMLQSRARASECSSGNGREKITELDCRTGKFGFIDARAVEEAFKSFGPRKAGGPDGLKPMVMQHFGQVTLERVAAIYRASLALGYVPPQWCHANVVLIPKIGKADYGQAKSFRPISLSSFLLRGLERLVLWKLEETTPRVRPFHPCQHAFRHSRGTDTALSVFADKVEGAILRGSFCIGVFFDIEGAFDNIMPEAMVRRLGEHGIDQDIVRWCGYYLRNREASVEIKGTSSRKVLTRGTPQGGSCLL